MCRESHCFDRCRLWVIHDRIRHRVARTWLVPG
jgi:hypothetical protein